MRHVEAIREARKAWTWRQVVGTLCQITLFVLLLGGLG